MKIALLWAFSLLVVTLAMVAPPVFAQNHSPTVHAYANAYGVSLDEAERRNAMANMARELQEKIKRELPDSFAGMYLEHVPEHRAVVLLTGNAPAQLQRFTSDEFYVARQVSYSLELMKAVQVEIGNLLQRSSVPFYVSLDIESNELVVTVEHMEKATMELAPLRSLYDFVRLEQGDLPVPVELIGGAVVGGYDDFQEYRESTLGFNVVTSDLELGIIGSGHAVNNSVEVDGQPMALEFIDEWVGGNFDVQLFVQNSLQPLPQSNHIYTYDNINPVIEIDSTNENLLINETVCKAGRTTKSTCGKVVDLSTLVLNENFPGMFIQVAPLVPFQRVIDEGDSGGPVYQDHSAVGIAYAALGHRSKVHPKHGWMLFMPIDRLAELGLGVITDNFDIDSVPNVSGPQNSDISATVNFRGYPRFPVIRRTEVVECDPSGNWSCSDYNATYTVTQATPLAFTFRCNSGSGLPTATFRWRTTLEGADGVMTSGVEHTSTCVGSSSASRPRGVFAKGTITIAK